jgi:catechol-2,3-dioxygenase
MTERTSLPATTRCGVVSLIVTDLARSLRYYTERIGLRVHAERGATAELGAGEVLLRLTEQPGARPV